MTGEGKCGPMLVVVVMVASFAGVARAQSGSVPLGDVARQYHHGKARFVITNDELPSRPQELSSSPAAGGGEGVDAMQAKTGGDESEKKTPAPAADATKQTAVLASDETSEARKEVEALVKQEGSLIDQTVSLREQISAGPTDSRRDVLAHILEDKARDLSDVRVQLRSAEQRLLSLLSSAEKSAAQEQEKKAKETADADGPTAAGTADAPAGGQDGQATAPASHSDSAP